MIAALIGFALAFAESGLGLGVIVPGELAISSLAALAHGPGDTLALGGAVALGATAGDHLGYAVGRRGGVRLRDSRHMPFPAHATRTASQGAGDMTLISGETRELDLHTDSGRSSGPITSGRTNRR